MTWRKLPTLEVSVLLPPCLPRLDLTPGARAAQLADARSTYRYRYTWPPGVAVAAEVPRGDSYSARYVAELLPISWDLFRNALAAGDLLVKPERLRSLFEAETRRVTSLSPREVGDWFLKIARDISAHITDERPSSVDSYRRLCTVLPAPPGWESWDDDRTFAWQRLAGVNPMTLARVAALPDHVAIDEAVFRRSVGQGSLAAALAEGRLFACDFSLLDGAPGGSTHGRQKYLPAPYALFAAVGGALRPVAVQLGQRPDSGVVAPGDGDAWRVARMAVQVADANLHETIAHLGRTHMVMEAVTLALRRQLAARHPLHQLLLPHCEFTLPINNSAATNLIAPQGAVDEAFGATIEASAGLVKVGLDSFRLLDAGVPDEIAARGLDDRSILPEHPYRDDALPVFAAIRRFVAAYLRLFYPTDAEVAADVELAAFVDELGADDGGRLRGLRRPATLDDATRLIAAILWVASGQHAAVNFPQYPFMGVIPGMVGALWGAWPTGPVDDRTFLDLLPPYNLALLQVHTVYQLSAVRLNHLGAYPVGHFLQPQTREVVASFAAELAQVEAATAERNQGRWLPYPHLLPSNIPASIHI